jgi:hypothetical protein
VRVLKDRILELLAETAPAPAREGLAIRPFGAPALGDNPPPAPTPAAATGFFGRLGL